MKSVRRFSIGIIAIILLLFGISVSAIAAAAGQIVVGSSRDDMGLITDEQGVTQANFSPYINAQTEYSISNAGVLSFTDSSGANKSYTPAPLAGFTYSKWVDRDGNDVPLSGTATPGNRFYASFNQVRTVTLQSASPSWGQLRDETGVVQDTFNVSVPHATYYTIESGQLKIKDASSIQRVFTPVSKEGYSFQYWVDENSTPLPLTGGTITNNSIFNAVFYQPTYIDPPTAEKDLVYTGEVLTGVKPGTGYTLTDNTSTEPGSHMAVATLKQGYIWKDASTQPLNIPWYIAKAKSEITGVPESLTVNAQTENNVPYEFKGEGKISITTSNPKVAEVKLDSIKSVFLISAISEGTTIITLWASGTEHYEPSSPVELKLTVLGELVSVTLNANCKGDASGYFIEVPDKKIEKVLVHSGSSFNIAYDIDNNAVISFSDGVEVLVVAGNDSKLDDLKFQGRSSVVTKGCSFEATFILKEVSETINLGGYVLDESVDPPAPMPGVTVEFKVPGSEKVYQAVTDENGYYILQDLPKGEGGTLIIEAEGMLPIIKEISDEEMEESHEEDPVKPRTYVDAKIEGNEGTSTFSWVLYTPDTDPEKGEDNPFAGTINAGSKIIISDNGIITIVFEPESGGAYKTVVTPVAKENYEFESITINDVEATEGDEFVLNEDVNLYAYVTFKYTDTPGPGPGPGPEPTPDPDPDHPQVNPAVDEFGSASKTGDLPSVCSALVVLALVCACTLIGRRALKDK